MQAMLYERHKGLHVLSGEKCFSEIKVLFAILVSKITNYQTWFISFASHFQNIFNNVTIVWFLPAILKQTILALSSTNSFAE